jgi:protein phosphatase
MKSYAVTDIGRVRKLNEDAYYSDPDQIGLFIVADGMGGHQAGEVASALAVKSISEELKGSLPHCRSAQAVDSCLRDAVVRANRTIYELAMSDTGYNGMGTTVVVCAVQSGQAHIAHIGDSRAYLIRTGALRQLTTDHSLVQELLSRGRITEAEAVDHPRKNILTRALGTDPAVEVDTACLDLLPGDRIMLCTDGLTNHVDAQELLEFALKDPLQDACGEMIRLANERGGFDNMTVLICENTPAQEGNP